MLNLFDRCYRKEDPKMMHVSTPKSWTRELPLTEDVQHCAQTLQDFNGGASCVQIYVNQHDFFINRVRQVNDFNKDTELYVATASRDSGFNAVTQMDQTGRSKCNTSEE